MASAQDLGTLLRGIGQVRNLPSGAQELLSTITSIAEVSTGMINPDQLSDQNADGKVVLYRFAGCGYCRQAEAYMRSRQIPYSERDVEVNPVYKAEFKKLGGRGVPLFIMGDKMMGGFSKEAFDRNYADFRAAEAKGMNRPDPSNTSVKAVPVNTIDTGSSALRSGDVPVSKIAGVVVYREPGRAGARLATLARADEVIFMGEERNGMVRVMSAKGEGWIDRLMMKGP